jgi:hypothetical protein
VSRIEEVRAAFTSVRIESISAAFVARPDPKSDRGALRRRRQRHPGRCRSIACTDEQSPRERDRFARRFARRETRVPPASLRIGGPRAFRCTPSRRVAEKSIDASRERSAWNVAESEPEARASERGKFGGESGSSFRAGNTRGTRFSKLDWFGVQTTIEAHLDRDAHEREERSRKRAT